MNLRIDLMMLLTATLASACAATRATPIIEVPVAAEGVRVGADARCQHADFEVRCLDQAEAVELLQDPVAANGVVLEGRGRSNVEIDIGSDHGSIQMRAAGNVRYTLVSVDTAGHRRHIARGISRGDDRQSTERTIALRTAERDVVKRVLILEAADLGSPARIGHVARVATPAPHEPTVIALAISGDANLASLRR